MKLFKKLASFILAFAMVMAIAMPSVVMAADDGSITIKGANADHIFEAYQIFTGKVSGNTLSDIEWGNGVNEDGRNELGSAKENAKELKNEIDAKDFAYKVAKYLGTPAGESTRDGENYKIENLAPGYYLVKDKDRTVPDAETYTKFILKVVGTAKVTVKSEVPTSQKKVKDTNDTTGATTDWQDSADYDIGDQVPFQLTGTVANDFSDYKGAYKLVFHDKESAGLTFNPDTVEVKVDGTKIETGYTVKTTGLEDRCSFEVVFDDLKQIGSVHNGSVITVEYTSELNTKAEIGSAGNPNEMRMEFSNNPNVEQNGTTTHTPWDKVIVFTYKTVINKVDPDRNALKGAEFTLEKKVGDGDHWVEKADVKNDAGTIFTFTGLDDGVYRLTETKTPEGYNTMNPNPLEFTISATHEVTAENPRLLDLSGNPKSGDVTFDSDLENGSLTTNIVNKSGSTLPETGGMGTTVLYAAGTLMILAAAAFLVMKKKAESK